MSSQKNDDENKPQTPKEDVDGNATESGAEKKNELKNELTYDKLAEDLLRTMRITTNSRFEAAKRLKRLNTICFLSTTLASLGLILIPLLDVAGHNKVFTSTSLTVFQIFLAVCVLVYSATISTANFLVRSKEFLECGDKIKSIVNDYKLHIINCKDLDQDPSVKEYTDLYTNLLVGTENHEDVDYFKSLFLYNKKESIKMDYTLGLWTKSISFLKMYLPFVVLMMLELVFIADMLGYWNLLIAFHKEQQYCTYDFFSYCSYNISF